MKGNESMPSGWETGHSTVSLGVSCGGCFKSMGECPHAMGHSIHVQLLQECRSLVRITGSKSDSFPVGVGLRAALCRRFCS